MTDKTADTITEILADQIIEPVEAMRSSFDRDKLFELSESIRSQGLINPITVRPVADKFEIVAGNRRFRACGMAGIVRIPCVVRTMTDYEVYSLRAHENLFRDDIDPVDEALYIGKLVGDDEAKISQVAKMLNRSTQWVEDRLGILQYPDYFLQPLKDGQIKLGVAKLLAQIEDETYRNMFFSNALRDGMAIWQAEYYLSQWKAGVFKSGAEILPPGEGDKPQPTGKVRQRCAKCGGMAEDPNLTNVFVHITCPDEQP
jgi:ParB family chromosome partitioning protein